MTIACRVHGVAAWVTNGRSEQSRNRPNGRQPSVGTSRPDSQSLKHASLPRTMIPQTRRRTKADVSAAMACGVQRSARTRREHEVRACEAKSSDTDRHRGSCLGGPVRPALPAVAVGPRCALDSDRIGRSAGPAFQGPSEAVEESRRSPGGRARIGDSPAGDARPIRNRVRASRRQQWPALHAGNDVRRDRHMGLRRRWPDRHLPAQRRRTAGRGLRRPAPPCAVQEPG